MQTLNDHQLAVLRKIPAFAEMEARRVKSDENAKRLERVAAGLEKLEPIAPADPVVS